MTTRLGLHTAARAGCLALMDAYATAASIALATYAGRPMTLHPPMVFPDRLNESFNYDGLRQSTLVARLIAVWGTFDSKEAVTQRDTFVDGMRDEFQDNPHQVHAATLLTLQNITDLPVYNPDWGSAAQRQTSYYATEFDVEVLALEG